MGKKQILESIYQSFRQKTGYGMVVGVEQEFYIIPGGKRPLRAIEGKPDAKLLENAVCHAECGITDLKKALAPFPFFSEIEEEKGEGQFEVQISPTDNPAVMADIVVMLRELISKAEPVSFHAKPFHNQPGSGMHIHINLIDELGQNVFCKNGDNESVQLNYAVAGLLELMPASMKYFAPYEEAYIRYIDHGMDSPSTISWGANNRTTSIRLPSVPVTPHTRRIEHRVSAADADSYLTIAAILAGVEYGIVNKLENKHPKIWGNAFLPQYSLPKLPHSFAEAQNITHDYLTAAMESFDF